MSKKEPKEPYKSGGKWYLDGKLLDCHSCKYYTRSTDGDSRDDYCKFHKFKFKNDYSAGSDFSQCEHFVYDEPVGFREGCLPWLIWVGICVIYALFKKMF